MLFKLYKYDMRSIIRQILPIWIIAPVTSVIFAFFSKNSYEISVSDGEEYFIGDAIVPTIIGLVLFAIFIAMIVLTLLFVIQRFSKGLLGDEGYLMFTLPVNTRNLIFSKLFSSITVVVISVLDALLAITCIASVFEGSLIEVLKILNISLHNTSQALGVKFVPYVVVFSLVLITELVSGIYEIYVALSIGQLFLSHRIAAAVIAYVVMEAVLNTISGGFSLMGFAAFSESFLYNAGNFLTILIVGLIWNIVQIVGFHLATSIILKRKLNLI